jgi:hypothetical protein
MSNDSDIMDQLRVDKGRREREIQHEKHLDELAYYADNIRNVEVLFNQWHQHVLQMREEFRRAIDDPNYASMLAGRIGAGVLDSYDRISRSLSWRLAAPFDRQREGLDPQKTVGLDLEPES